MGVSLLKRSCTTCRAAAVSAFCHGCCSLMFFFSLYQRWHIAALLRSLPRRRAVAVLESVKIDACLFVEMAQGDLASKMWSSVDTENTGGLFGSAMLQDLEACCCGCLWFWRSCPNSTERGFVLIVHTVSCRHQKYSVQRHR